MKKIKTNCLLIFATTGLLFLNSCKKDNTQAPTGGGGSTNTTITPSAATSYYGILSISSLQTLSGGTLFPVSNYCQAYFSSSATSAYNTATFVKVNSVNLNGKFFKFSVYRYVDTTYTIAYPAGTWQVNGLANIPSFTFSISNALPTYTGYASLPDTVRINQQITLPISGISGADQTTIIISDGSNLSGHIVAQILGTSATSVTFSASSLASMNATSTTAFINVHGIKNNAQSVYGKPTNFTTEFQFNKYITIK